MQKQEGNQKQIKENVMHYVVNLTTNEYINCKNLSHRNKQLVKLMKKNTIDTALILDDIGVSRWNREDKIVIAPKNTKKYVEKNYQQIYI